MGSIADAFAPGLFNGRQILVVGGTSGIGLGAALAFQSLGARVVATGASEAERARAAAMLDITRIDFSALDVRNSTAITNGVARLQRLD